MNRSDCPNLYWALVALPHPILDIRRSSETTDAELAANVPLLTKARSQELTPQEWPQLMNRVAQVGEESGIEKKTNPFDFERELKPGGSGLLALPAAQQHYALSRNAQPDDVALLDAATVVGIYYFDQYTQAMDEAHRCLDLPYPQMLAKLGEFSNAIKRNRSATPGNPLLSYIPSFDRAALAFVHVERHIAALTAVEAIRSYAAAHAGKLPEHLEDITDTPVPLNPETDKPFFYRVEKDSAVLSGPEHDLFTLEYTIQIRK